MVKPRRIVSFHFNREIIVRIRFFFEKILKLILTSCFASIAIVPELTLDEKEIN